MPTRLTHRLLLSASAACAALALLLSTPRLHAAPATSSPKLAVIVVVDQMRADYVDRFQGEWTGGFKRLLREGAWFRRAAYPYLTTVTCAGHATVSTGAYPHVHGIIQNVWWDREAAKPLPCTSDDAARGVTYGGEPATGESARWLNVPTFADVMRTEHGAHVVTVSLKARSAIMLAGHGGDAAVWLSDGLDGWVSSSVFGDRPSPIVEDYVDHHPIAADYGKTWNRLLPAPRYREPDDAPGEAPPKGWTRTFPHALRSASGRPDSDFGTLWERSPYADAYLGQLAADLVDGFQLGKHDGTDVFGVSFSTPDLVGHLFGPDSQEEHDLYLRLDRTLGALLDRLDAAVGRGQYTLALTADHGVTPLPEELKHEGRDGGRIDSVSIAAIVEDRARAALGAGRYVARANGNDVYFAPGMYEKVAGSPAAMQSVIDGLKHSPGIADVLRAEQVRGAASSSDRVVRAAALSYFQGRSGDLILVPKPGWMFVANGTTHGTASEDDQRVPVILFGKGIKHAVLTTPATPADIAPTFAAMLGVSLPAAEGHPLTDALEQPNGAPRRSSGR